MSPIPAPVVCALRTATADVGEETDVKCEFWDCQWFKKTQFVSTLKRLFHLPRSQALHLLSLFSTYREVFGSVPGRTYWNQHDVCVCDAAPVKLPIFHITPRQAEALCALLDYMLDLGIHGVLLKHLSPSLMEESGSASTTRKSTLSRSHTPTLYPGWKTVWIESVELALSPSWT